MGQSGKITVFSGVTELLFVAPFGAHGVLNPSVIREAAIWYLDRCLGGGITEDHTVNKLISLQRNQLLSVKEWNDSRLLCVICTD